MIKKNKEKFKSNLLSSADEFKRAANNLKDNFVRDGPFGSKFTIEQAFDSIAGTRNEILELTKQEANLKRGLAIFDIDQGNSKELEGLVNDLNYLEKCWNHTKEWSDLWDDWKQSTFQALVTDNMSLQAQSLFQVVNRLGREIKDKDWSILDETKKKIMQFQRTMPLIEDLKNPAMRDRHWLQIKTEVAGGKKAPQDVFDETSDEFTLAVIIDLKLDTFTELIQEVSGAASKELSIEQTLEEIDNAWNSQDLIISPYKDRGHYILKTTEEINQLLDDHQVTLATMKGSRFVKAFEKIVDKWERTLSHIMECLEMIQQVQRQWLYLENIFIGEDIRKQLPRETLQFDDVNASWKTIMENINTDLNAKRATGRPGLLEKLNSMNTMLEEIQKSLDMYLETKRQIFPRFYFLSNDDLLEILGQAKDPMKVQPHMKKCFDNIKCLNIVNVQTKNYADAMISSENESVPFKDLARGIEFKPVLLEGPVEGWLCEVERSMKWVLKDYLKKAKADLKKKLSKRDKWIQLWPGQITITASQIQWTTDVTKALDKCKDMGDKKPLKYCRKKQNAVLSKYSEAIV